MFELICGCVEMLSMCEQSRVGLDLASSFVGPHLQTDGGLVVGFVRLSLWIIQMSSGSVRRHSSLAGTFVCSHLRTKVKLFHPISVICSPVQ